MTDVFRKRILSTIHGSAMISGPTNPSVLGRLEVKQQLEFTRTQLFQRAVMKELHDS